ncbi:glycosyltransferase family 39 protein [Roseospira navarrensis]|nr:glycosyltransferase family 39 protein [Roseospira navarrensis]
MNDVPVSTPRAILARAVAAICGPWGVAVLVFAITAARLVLLSSELALPVMPGEADFWLLGQTNRPLWPETGPALPWLLGLLSETCGADAPCLRLWGPVAHGIAMWFVYRLGVRLFDTVTGFWCAVLYGTLPLVMQGGLVVGPIALMMPLWTLALLALARTHVTRGLWEWGVLGASVGLGLLVHPVMALFVPLALLYLATSPEHAGVWRRPGPYVAILVGLACLLPELLRAAADDWAAAERLLAAVTSPIDDPWNLASTIGIGILLAGPVLAAVLIWLLIRMPALLRSGAWSDYRVRLLLLFSAPVLAVTLALTLVRDDGAMLTGAAVPAALVMVCGWLLVRGQMGWTAAALAANVAVSAALLIGPQTLRAEGWVVPAGFDPVARQRMAEAAGHWLEALARAHPGVTLAVAGADAPLLAYHAAVRDVPTRVVGTHPLAVPQDAFHGLLVMPAALAEADAGGDEIRGRLTVTLPDGRTTAWAAAMVP